MLHELVLLTVDWYERGDRGERTERGGGGRADAHVGCD